MALRRSTARTRYHMLEARRVNTLNPPTTLQPTIFPASVSSVRLASAVTMCPTAIRESSTVLKKGSGRRGFVCILSHKSNFANTASMAITTLTAALRHADVPHLFMKTREE